MRTKNLRRAGVAMACALLGSCLGGGGAGDTGQAGGLCTSMADAAARVTKNGGSGCFGCSVTNEQNVADGNLTTAASMDVPTSFTGQGPTIRATAQSGVVFSGGQQAAVLFVPPVSGGVNPPDQSVTLKTYLAGQEQEAGATYTTQAVTGGLTFKGFVTTKPFDAIEVMVSDTEAAASAWEIHELCSEGIPQ